MYIKIYKYKQENPKMTNRELANKTIIFYGGNK